MPLPARDCTPEEAKQIEMEVTKVAAEDVLLGQADRMPVVEGHFGGVFVMVTAGDNYITIYKGDPGLRRELVNDIKVLGGRFDKRDYIQQVDVSVPEARLILKGLLKLVSILDVLADTP
jgi:hypothetical protein